MTFDSIPTQVNAGDDLSWTSNPDGYPATGFLLSYGLLSEDGTEQITVKQSGSSGGLALFTVAGSDTAKWKPLVYYYQLYAFAISGGARTQIEQGRVQVLPDLSQTQDPTQNQRTLKNISDLLEGKASDEIQTCSVNGKNLTSYSLTDLIGLRTYYQGLVTQEINARRIAAGFRSKRTIKIRFAPTGGSTPTRPPIPGY